jgi:phosphopantothenoylcysteine decarboxylase/phosphopantothenate--cysteine ligase
MSAPKRPADKQQLQQLAGRRIILGVGGGIAAYKCCDLASKLFKEGALVTAVLTRNARKFVTPYAFEALTGQPCLTRAFKRIEPGENPYPHIEPARTAELVILAPATADLMAKLAHGLADELLPTLMLTVRCPVLICPAMNVQMWEHPATQANVKTLRRFGHEFCGPASGSLACGMEGAGRMSEPAAILEAAVRTLNDD